MSLRQTQLLARASGDVKQSSRQVFEKLLLLCSLLFSFTTLLPFHRTRTDGGARHVA